MKRQFDIEFNEDKATLTVSIKDLQWISDKLTDFIPLDSFGNDLNKAIQEYEKKRR